MDQLSAPSTSSVGLFQGGDMTAETVMSELNIFRGTGSLPGWENSTASHMPPHTHPHTTTESTASPGHLSSSSDRNSYTDQAGPSGLHDHDTDENGLPYPMTPPTSTPESVSSRSNNGDTAQDETESRPPARKKRTPIPDSKKDGKYWERRRKNNLAAKRSREQRKKKMEGELVTAKEAIEENTKLKQEIEVLKSEINSLRRLLRDANMTLSLWIRAKQASEPNAQLPPMLRSPNVSFVNFPVSSTI